MNRRNFGIALGGWLAACAGIARADCRLRSGDIVVLYGTSDDPDVFLWDSRFRMRQYEEGTFDEMNALLPHAVLARPGTRALVVSCVSGFVRSKYSETPDDAVGVRIISGPLHGQGGWVLGSSVRGSYHPVKEP
jgi:hypothetical protein